MLRETLRLTSRPPASPSSTTITPAPQIARTTPRT